MSSLQTASAPSSNAAAPFAPRSIHLIAPSGWVSNLQTVQRGIARLRAAGHRVENSEVTQRQMQRFAGTDQQRLADLNKLADPAQPLPDIVLAIRGGYGALRLLAELDYAGLQRRLRGAHTALVGFSDFTAIQLALLAKADLITFGGPVLGATFGAEELDTPTWEHFWRMLSEPVTTLQIVEPQAHTLNVRGTLWGGNLAMLTALVGTPYLPHIEGGILFIEDVNEPPYRIERMLYQLHYAGILARQQAVLLGEFSQCTPAANDNGYTLQTVIEQARRVFGLPFLQGLPFGHGKRILALPVGAQAELQADEHGFALRFSGYPYQAC